MNRVSIKPSTVHAYHHHRALGGELHQALSKARAETANRHPTSSTAYAYQLLS